MRKRSYNVLSVNIASVVHKLSQELPMSWLQRSLKRRIINLLAFTCTSVLIFLLRDMNCSAHLSCNVPLCLNCISKSF